MQHPPAISAHAPDSQPRSRTLSLCIQGGEALLADGLARTDLLLEAGTIAQLAPAPTPAPVARTFDASGLWVLPGIVDLHGDAFERQLQPRPGVEFPLPLALADTEAQLLANGITTAFHAITLSWEPGLRSPEAWTALSTALAARPAHPGCDMRAHMRWEMHNLGALDLALSDIEAGRVGMLSFNDHTPSILRKIGTPDGAVPFLQRAKMQAAPFRALAEQAAAHAPHVPAAAERLAAAARHAGIPIASHDDDTPATRAAFRALGATICEFPTAEDVGLDARAAHEPVVMGCPNVVRGGSHLGWASAARLAERGICTVLCSDYYYPAMAQAALILGRGPLGLPAAWSLVSRNPALAANLPDRGLIAPGLRADLALLTPEGRILATITQGAITHLAPGAYARLH